MVFLSAGETSGDRHAAAVVRRLRTRRPDLRFVGLGGPHMEETGVELLAGLEDLAVMGFGEPARHLRFFRDLRRRVHRRLAAGDVRLVIPVGYPGFNLPLAAHAKQRNIHVLYYIAPQVWAWRRGRARILATACDRVLTVLPFEDELLHRYGIDSRFVGHPLLDEPPLTAHRDGEPLLGIFPGSRAQEVELILPTFAEAACRIQEEFPDLRFQVAQAPHLPDDLYTRFGLPLGTTEETIARATAALTKSGTITLELALAGVPMVVGYRTRRITYALAKRLVRVPSITLANLVTGERIVPEFVQRELTAPPLAAAVRPLLDPESPERARMLSGLARVRAHLGDPGCADRVAEHAAGFLE